MHVTSAPKLRSQGRRTWLVAVAVTLTIAGMMPAPRAFAVDLHAFWDSRCASCHRHAGEFARNHLKVKEGRLAGRKPDRDVCAFLVGHGAGEERAEEVCRMLTAQSATPSVFKAKCAGCHETAADLARTGLVRDDGGALNGRTGGRELGVLLEGHGKLEPGELAIVVETLLRVYFEVHGTGK